MKEPTLSSRKKNLDLSIIIPLFNEEESLKELYNEIRIELKKLGVLSFETIFINDGSTDASQNVIEKLHQKNNNHIKYAQLRTNQGKSTALSLGFKIASGKRIITLDADLQDDPKEIQRFLSKLDEGFDLVSGWKKNRKDSSLKNISSKFFNFIVGKTFNLSLHDMNSGFKAYRAEVLDTINIYGELHRYIPAFASFNGFRVTEIAVSHRKRKYGKSKFGLVRFIHGFLDLLTAVLITKFRSRPLHLFGYIGLLFLMIGVAIAVYLTYVKFILGESIGTRPLLLFSVMLMIMGVQIGVFGLVGELITLNSNREASDFNLKKISK